MKRVLLMLVCWLVVVGIVAAEGLEEKAADALERAITYFRTRGGNEWRLSLGGTPKT